MGLPKLKKIDVSQLPTVQGVQNAPCCLYVIQEGKGEHFKIGVAGHPARRLSALQGGNRNKLKIVAAYSGTRVSCFYVERAALKFFKANAGSEWVWVTGLGEIIEFLDSFLEDQG